MPASRKSSVRRRRPLFLGVGGAASALKSGNAPAAMALPWSGRLCRQPCIIGPRGSPGPPSKTTPKFTWVFEANPSGTELLLKHFGGLRQLSSFSTQIGRLLNTGCRNEAGASTRRRSFLQKSDGDPHYGGGEKVPERGCVLRATGGVRGSR